MKQEEKWPIFQPSPKSERKAQHHLQPQTFLSVNGGQDTDELFEEMSGMVTLKRKGKEKNSYGSEQGQSFDNHPGLQSLF